MSCAAHRVSRETVRQALEVLEQDGLIERSRSRGTLTVPAGVRAWRRLRRSRVIALITGAVEEHDVPTSFYGRINQGIFAAGDQAGYSISTRSTGAQFPGVGERTAPEDPTRVLGVIISGVQDERLIAMHAQAGYPVVVVDYWSHNPQVDCLVIDCFGEGERAAEFLLEQGHRDMFYLGNMHGPKAALEHEADADLLLAGFERALRRHGVPFSREQALFCRLGSGDASEMARRVAKMCPRPTAGVIFSSQTLQAFLAALPECGLACPQDISLLCKSFAGEEIEAAMLCGDAGLMGRRAVDVLLERVSGKRQQPECVALRSKVVRGPTVRQIATS